VSLQRDGAQAVLTVADSGPGMSEEEAARVFERFWRADESRSRARGGAGLGLSIVGAIAAAHGGRASARSAPGEGATFVVELPLDGAHRNSTGV
jgi:two-component system OmpR family sensor kinase